MKDNTNIFIHIGLHKTGTTFLQQNIYGLWENMEYLNTLWFPYMVLIQPRKKYIISNETLCGRPWGRPKSMNIDWSEERKLVLLSLKRLYPHARILLSIRNHRNLLLSMYKQYLHEGGVLKLHEFYDLETDSGIIKKDDIKFMELIQFIEEIFEHKPFVFSMEELFGDLPLFLKKLESIFDEKAPTAPPIKGIVNEGVRYWQGKLLRSLNIIDKKPGSYINSNGLFALTNNLTLWLRLDPRTLCQKKLRFLSKKQIQFSKEDSELIDRYYKEDWEASKNYIEHFLKI